MYLWRFTPRFLSHLIDNDPNDSGIYILEESKHPEKDSFSQTRFFRRQGKVVHVGKVIGPCHLRWGVVRWSLWKQR